MFNSVSTSTSAVPMNEADSKQSVAELLSSLANGHPRTQYSSGVLTPTTLTSGVSSTSVSTPLLTPTTLASIEQIVDLHSEASTSGPIDLSTESGFVAPLVEPVTVKQEFPDFSYGSGQKEDPDWLPPSAKRFKASSSDRSMVATTMNYTLPAVTPNATITSSGARRPTGPRPRRSDIHLAPEEEHRRTIRRERNKVAAAKCRQKRVDLTNSLINETEGLEEEQAKLEEEIQSLQAQKEQLEFLLKAHNPLCNRKSQTTYKNTVTVTESHGMPVIKVEKAPSPAMSRPTSLAIKPQVSMARPVVMEATGISITTPSSGVNVFNFGLEAMMDGHSGLTPITGAPSCASEVQRSISESSSGSSLMAL